MTGKKSYNHDEIKMYNNPESEIKFEDNLWVEQHKDRLVDQNWKILSQIEIAFWPYTRCQCMCSSWLQVDIYAFVASKQLSEQI